MEYAALTLIFHHLLVKLTIPAGAIEVLRFFQLDGIRQGTIYGDSMLVVKLDYTQAGASSKSKWHDSYLNVIRNGRL